MIVDSHAHIWSGDEDRYPWQPTFGYVPDFPASPEVLLAHMDTCGVQLAVIVQPSVYGDDHRFVLDTVAAHPDRFVAVGQVNPLQQSSVDNARRLVDGPHVAGLRVLLAPDPALAACQAEAHAWDELVRLGVTISLRAMPSHHRLVLGLLRRFPDACFVVDHLGLPDLADQGGATRRLVELARYDNCCVKVAGFARLRADSGYPADPMSIWPLVRECLQAFGATRMVWGSDFPGDDAHTVLGNSLGELSAMSFLGESDRVEILGNTATRLWRLAPPMVSAARIVSEKSHGGSCG